MKVEAINRDQKTQSIILMLAVICAWVAPGAYAFASSPLLYQGTAEVTTFATGQTIQQPFLLKKSMDPSRSEIVEVACVKEAGRPAYISPVYMQVSGNLITAISNKPTYDGTLTGTGTLVGAPWNWSDLTFSMEMTVGGGHVVRIEDENIVRDDHLIARKKIFSDGSPSGTWEADALLIDESDFAEAAQRMGCPSL